MRQRVIRYIREYVGRPSTAEEVMAWWRGMEEISDSLDLLTETLEALVAEEVIEKDELEKGFFIYRISRGG